MKKTVISLLTLITIFAIPSTAQVVEVVHDEQKEKQWRSMEVGPWDFAPDWYYYFMHKKYSGASSHWQWQGIHSGMRVSFDESKSDIKTINPTRILEEETQRKKIQEVEAERQRIEELYKEDVANQLDRLVDTSYSMYKDDFNKMQLSIEEGLATCLIKSKFKLQWQVDEILQQNEVICANIEYIHKTGYGYELENSKRQRAYEDAKVAMRKLVKRTSKLLTIAYAYF
jgi:hypothetical protein